MKLRAVLALFAAVVAASAAFAAEPVHWGAVTENLQLGVEITANPEPTLHVLLRNTGKAEQDLPFGFESDPENPPNLIITTRGLRKSEVRAFDTIGAKHQQDPDRGPARTLKLPPGGSHEFTYLLSQLVCVINRSDISLTDLLKQGYTVRAAFGFRQTAVVSGDASFKK